MAESLSYSRLKGKIGVWLSSLNILYTDVISLVKVSENLMEI